MPPTLLGLQSYGTGFPRLFSVTGVTTTNLSNTFATHLVSAVSGQFQHGETITATTGGYTAVITQVIANITISSVVGTFAQGETITLSPNGATATVVHNHTTSLDITNMSASFPNSGTSAVGGTSGATATVSGYTVSRLILNSMSAGYPGSATTLTGGTSGATATAGTFEGLTTPTGYIAMQDHTIQFKGIVYAFHYNTVYQLNESTSNMEENFRLQVATPTPVVDSTYATRRSGLFVIYISDVPYLCSIFCSSSGFWRMKYVNGKWNLLRLSTSVTTLQSKFRYIQHKNIVYFHPNDALTVCYYTWNPETDGISNPLPSSNVDGAYPGALSEFSVIAGRVCFVRVSAGVCYLYYTNAAGSAYNIVTLTPSTTGAPSVFFSDNNFSYFTGDSTRIHKINSSFTVSLASVSWPAHSGDNTTSVPQHLAFSDNETNAGTNGGPRVQYLYHATNSSVGTNRSLYQWVNDTSGPTLIASGGCPNEIVLTTNSYYGGGSRFFVSGQLDCLIVSKTTALGGVRIGFIIYKKPGTANVANVSFKLQYLAEGNYALSPVAWGTLSNPSVGAISGGKTMTGLTADSSTIYYVDWLAVSSDAVSNNSNAIITPVVSV